MKAGCLDCGALMGRGPWARCEVCNSANLAFAANVVDPIPPKVRGVAFTPIPEPKTPRKVRDIAAIETPRLVMDPWGWGRELPRGAVVALSADAGVGKSTFLVRSLSSVEGGVLYGASEEGTARIAERIRRIGGSGDIYLVHSTSMFELLEHARNMRPDVFVVDSLNKTTSVESNGQNAGLVDKMSALSTFALATGVTCVVICHVNSDGELWGPNTLRHLTDINVEIEAVEGGEYDGLRIIKGVKNRFGPTGRYGAFRHYEDGIRPSEEDVDFDKAEKGEIE